MRIRRQSFEQLVKQNKREIMENEDSLNQLELKLEKRHVMNLEKDIEDGYELLSNER